MGGSEDGKDVISRVVLLLVSFGSCAQLPDVPVNITVHQGRHLDVNNSTADVAETPDEHIQERLDEAGHHQ
ncbi:hypothetical protein [Type-E symbiont of Plautia stali]|uniref:hypothetical protein n=1 Tax=Type-E symbiont of Plautia stali TaxID=1560357 RepID=UPI00073E218D|nr:hypothetical protein [Type-E symbiont of Plautia stali]